MRAGFNWRHVLYRLVAADGTLLYVGITNNVASRFSGHARKGWWAEVAEGLVEFHPDRESLEDAERQAIRAEKPLYNVAHSTTLNDAAAAVRREAAQQRSSWLGSSWGRTALDRCRNYTDEIARINVNIAKARQIRDGEVRRLCAEHGPAKTAQMTGLSLGSVKAINRGNR